MLSICLSGGLGPSGGGAEQLRQSDEIVGDHRQRELEVEPRDAAQHWPGVETDAKLTFELDQSAGADHVSTPMRWPWHA